MEKIHVKTILIVLLVVSAVYAQESVTLLGTLNPHGAQGYNDIWGYAAEGREYAILGTGNGTSFIDVTNPSAPIEVAFISGPTSTWRDMKVHSNYAYVVTEDEGDNMGLQIIDLSNLPNSVELVKASTEIFETAHNIFIDDGFAYVIGSNRGGGILILDLSDPVNPVLTSNYTASNFVHDVYVWNDTIIASAASTYDVVDVTDKSNPLKVSSSSVLPNIYAHSGWMTEDKRYFIAAEEANERDMMVWDLADRTNWKLVVDRFSLSNDSPIHNIFVRGNYAHISYYKEGYVVLDISNPEQPIVAGQFDTYPSTQGTFNGAWGCYPFLPSGNILISDIQKGLYLFEFNPPENPEPFISLVDPVTEKLEKGSVDIEVVIYENGTVVDNALYYRIQGESGEWIRVEGIPDDSNNFIYTIPQQSNRTVVEYFITAEDDDGLFVTSPKGGSKESGQVIAPVTYYSIEYIFVGPPIILSVTPNITDTTITLGDEIEFEVEAIDTSGLELEYRWFFRGGLRSFRSNYTHRSNSHIVPRTDTVKLEISNSYKITKREFYVHIEEATSVNDAARTTYDLAQNYPNPFNPTTQISYSLAEAAHVSLKVYNSLGEEVGEIVNQFQQEGRYEMKFTGDNLSSGVYILRLQAGNYNETIKMLLIK